MQKSLIISCVNLGASHSANYATYEIMEAELATNASLMVPCPWSREAAQNKTLENISVGIQLTLNAECDNYRWAPITQSPSLYDGNGGFPKTLTDLWDHADPDEVWRECRAQIERAMLWGLKISHLGSHLDVLLPRPEYFDIYLELSKEFKLPLRLPSTKENEFGFPFRELADQAKVLVTDKAIYLDADTDISKVIAELESDYSVAEILCSPLLDTQEARAIYPKNYTDGIGVKQKLEELNSSLKDLDIQLISWSQLSEQN